MLSFLSGLLAAMPVLMPVALWVLKMLGKNEDELKEFQEGVTAVQVNRRAATRPASDIRDAEQQLDELQHVAEIGNPAENEKKI